MKTKHTKGPWKVEQYENALEVWSQNTFVCSTDSKLFRTAHSQFEDAPNAALIAAAPEIFEALRDLVNRLATVETLRPDIEKSMLDALGVIQKARGE